MHSAIFMDFYNESKDKEYIKETLLMADRLVVLSKSWKRYFNQLCVPEERIVIINNPVCAPQYIETTKNKPVRMLFLGDLRERKGVWDILKALCEHRDELEDKLEFRIGGNKREAEIRQYITDNGLSDFVKFEGWVAGNHKWELLNWAKHSDLHMLIRICVFHYELELIHPFADGIGRVGRLWHTLLLSKWNSVFAWLPVESIIHDHQQEYYDAINASNDAGESTAFIEFMLSVIKASLIDAIHTSDAMSARKTDKKALRWQKIEQFLQTHAYIMNADVRELCGVSAATANRILAGSVKDGKLSKRQEENHWAYKINL